MADPDVAPEVAQAALDRAEEEKNLLIVYQPIHDARTKKIVAAEALLRQRRQTGEIREAAVIAEAAEAGPELFKLDSFALRTAFTDAAQWQSRGAPEVRISVNVSPREFQEGNVLPRLKQLVSGCGNDTRKISLEITETSYIEKPEETEEVINELKKLGLEVWLDDFGTGHSSMTHLQHLSVDGMKLPGEFVKGIDSDSRCRTIAHSLLNLAHDLGLKVVAEGIERESQLAVLRDWNCEYIQGFLWSKPMELDDFVATLRR